MSSMKYTEATLDQTSFSLADLQAKASQDTLQGIFDGISSQDYHQGPGISSTYLKKARAASFLHAETERNTPRKPTPALIFGQAVHAMIEGQEIFEGLFCKEPLIEDHPDALTTTDTLKARCLALGIKLPAKALKSDMITLVKQADPCVKIWDEFVATCSNGKVALDAEKYKAVLAIAEKVAKHPSLAPLLQGAKYEQSAWWKDKSGVLCKVRPDVLTPEGVILDWKTTSKQATIHSFQNDAYKYGYHFSAAMYLEGISNSLGVPLREFALIAIETTAPYELVCYQLDEASLSAGLNDFRRAITQYAECLKTGRYPGYPTDFLSLSLPQYAWSYAEETVE